MDPLNILKQLKKLEPDPEYTRASRRTILARTEAREAYAPFSIGKILIGAFQTGSTIVLTGILLVLILGGFSAGRLLTPFKFSGLSPDSLRAEADAIDIQIKLTDLSYGFENVTTTIAVSAPTALRQNTPTGKESSLNIQKEIAKQAAQLGITTTSSAALGITVDGALDKLAE